MKYDVFISYSSKDSGVAFDVCAMLEAAGLLVGLLPGMYMVVSHMHGK